jgi:Na+-transporting NADH:ubiquinone oxidoreductase subunit NqrA
MIYKKEKKEKEYKRELVRDKKMQIIQYDTVHGIYPAGVCSLHVYPQAVRLGWRKGG